VSGQQSFVIDRGEQVHTLEAAKALLAAQVAAFPPQVEEAFDEDEAYDIESESEVETDESEGLGDEVAAGESAAGEGAGGPADADGPRRKRRRRRRGRAGEPREGGPLREEHDAPRIAADAETGEVVTAADEGESDEDESEETQGFARNDQGPGGERRPRRRGRRGGRRRRGGPEDGLAGSIADELGPTSAPEAAGAVADFDGTPPEQPWPEQPRHEQPRYDQALPEVQPESIAPQAASQHTDHAPQETALAQVTEETAQEADKAAARRRSTVREKVSFLVDAQPASATPADHAQPEPPAAAPAPAQPAAEAPTETQPRKAGWWSRRFGGGE